MINIEHLERYHADSENTDREKKHISWEDFEQLPEWEVERILGEKWFKGRKRRIKKYLTRLTGFSPDWNKYLTRQQLWNAPDVLLEWEASNKQSNTCEAYEDSDVHTQQ